MYAEHNPLETSVINRAEQPKTKKNKTKIKLTVPLHEKRSARLNQIQYAGLNMFLRQGRDYTARVLDSLSS